MKLDTKPVYAFEPNPDLVEQMRENFELNGLQDVEIFAGACADKEGKMELYLGEDDRSSSLMGQNPGSAIEVSTTSLDGFFYRGGAKLRRPSFIKMDIEGAGVLALPGATRCLQEMRPLLYLESHSPEEDRQIGTILTTLDFQALRVRERQWVELPNETYPNPRGVWGNLLACPTEHQNSIAQALGLESVRRHRVNKTA